MSDLHFGRTSPELVNALLDNARTLKPDVVVVSGDLTQRARPAQFQEARGFLQAIAVPKVVIPGNHDIPLYNVVARFLRPLANYRKFISREPWPAYRDEAMAILGMNTARSLARAEGSISDSQIEYARAFFCSAGPEVIKILVTHHPFDFPETVAEKHLVRRARRAIVALAACEADLYLAGHAHVPYSGLTARRYKAAHRAALIVQAGTGVSTRTRSGPNSFNLIVVEPPYVRVQHFDWDRETSGFVGKSVSDFKETGAGWQATKEKRQTA
jgi:3',5'-cyclic AMP phosphodiesterase CpdA